MATDAQAPVPYWQHQALEAEVRRVREKVDKNSARLMEREKQGAADMVEFREMRADILRLEGKVDRLVWAIVGLALTVAGTAIGIAITIGAGP